MWLKCIKSWHIKIMNVHDTNTPHKLKNNKDASEPLCSFRLEFRFRDLNFLLWLLNLYALLGNECARYICIQMSSVKDITCCCVSVAQAEGAPTNIAGTAAADSNSLDLFDPGDITGPGFKGYHLDNSDNKEW